MGSDCWQAVVGRNAHKSLGKRKTQIVAVGTLAPAPLTGPGAWWPDFIKQGSGDGRHVSPCCRRTRKNGETSTKLCDAIRWPRSIHTYDEHLSANFVRRSIVSEIGEAL